MLAARRRTYRLGPAACALGVVLAGADLSELRAADYALPPRAPSTGARSSPPRSTSNDAPPEDAELYFEPARTPAPPPIREEVLPPHPRPTHWQKVNPFHYLRHSVNQGAVDRHHEKWWQFRDSTHHGWPYGCSPYAGRAVGASYHLPEWAPRRSVYYAYQPGYSDLPYGFSPEPYYGPTP